MTIKKDPELQHVLAHLWNAIDYAARGEPSAAEHELESIAGLIFWDDDDKFVAFTRGDNDGEEEAEPMQEAKPETDETDEGPARIK